MPTPHQELAPRALPADPGIEYMLNSPGELTRETRHEPVTAAREAELRRLLDPPMMDHKGNPISYGNFEYARDSGLLDEFAYDPDQHYDGLMHILVGNVRTINGRTIVGGFHINHDPEYVRQVYGSYEDPAAAEGLSAQHRKQYVDRPFEPRKSRVFIGGVTKDRFVKDKHGVNRLSIVGSTLFPREYDPLAAMQAIKIAKYNRDTTQDQLQEDGRIIATGFAPMIDGKTMMEVALVLTPDEKVISAYPRVKEKGYMKLSEAAIDKALGLREDDVKE